MATDLRTILQLKVPVIVQIGRRKMPLDDVLALGPGAIIDLNMDADAPLSLLVNNKPIAMGAAVKVGENFGLRIEQIGSARQRIAALGSDASGDSVADDEPASESADESAAQPQTQAGQ